MTTQQYVEINFKPETLELIGIINAIIADYTRQGYDLTLRQLYYQLVARDLIPNDERSYKRIGTIVNDGRLAGLISWQAIVDRTRSIRSINHFETPRDVIRAAHYSYRIDKWQSQTHRVEVWVEKDALIGVIARICNQLDVPYFAARGYASQSAVWGAAQRLLGYQRDGQSPVVLYLGDHDPSGIDMTRDVADRLKIFWVDCEVRRVALNFDQVERYQPPPNPTKITDSRATGYIAEHGYECWELDALDPNTVSNLIEHAVLDYRDEDEWKRQLARETAERQLLAKTHDNWDKIARHLKNGGID